jgi:hypothetical protein
MDSAKSALKHDDENSFTRRSDRDIITPLQIDIGNYTICDYVGEIKRWYNTCKISGK